MDGFFWASSIRILKIIFHIHSYSFFIFIRFFFHYFSICFQVAIEILNRFGDKTNGIKSKGGKL